MTNGVLEVAPAIGGRLSDHLFLGARLSSVFKLFAGNESYTVKADPFHDRYNQFALEPYVLGTFGAGFFLARFTHNLDQPDGPSFDRGRFWGIHAGGGAAF